MTKTEQTHPAKTQGVPRLEKVSLSATKWIGSVPSLVVHTILFIGVLSLSFFGFDFDRILLILTTLLSFEAIYLAIFIQMTVNRNTAQLFGVKKDIEEIQEDVEEISEDIEVIQEDVEEISEDIEEIQEDVEEISEDDSQEEKDGKLEKNETKLALAKLEHTLGSLLKEIELIKRK